MHTVEQHKSMKNDPPTLKDTITKVERLNISQLLTAAIILSSMVNMMSNEDD